MCGNTASGHSNRLSSIIKRKLISPTGLSYFLIFSLAATSLSKILPTPAPLYRDSHQHHCCIHHPYFNFPVPAIIGRISNIAYHVYVIT